MRFDVTEMTPALLYRWRPSWASSSLPLQQVMP
jgi:hypothetical protein